jgi:hypothetical protein
MNEDFETIETILAELKFEYAAQCPLDVEDPEAPVTERDIVAEIRQRLKAFCRSRRHHVHCEIKPVFDDNATPEYMKSLPRIDVVILSDKNYATWLAAAKMLQDKYRKGSIEARFSSVPVGFFHTAIEVKIQSNVANAKEDIDALKMIADRNPLCNCFFVLLNARGRLQDHHHIQTYAREKGISVIEYVGDKERHNNRLHRIADKPGSR